MRNTNQNRPQNRYPFGSSMASFSNTEFQYSFGFNNFEKDDEVKGDANHISFGDYGYDPRIGRRWRPDPESSFYPGYSVYTFALNSPIWAYDVGGKLVIFSHGFILQDGLGNKKSSKEGEKFYPTDYYGEKSKANDYWGCIDNKFMERLNDYNVLYANGENTFVSKAQTRMDEGKLAALELHRQIENGEVVLQRNSAGEIIETITLVGHSQGAAYSAGIASKLIELGYKVDAVYYITPHQPEDIVHPTGPLGIQYSHPNDRVSSNPPWWLPNGGTSYGEIVNISEKWFWQNPEWDMGMNGDRGGHNVGLNWEIFLRTETEKGYVRPKGGTDNTYGDGYQEIQLPANNSSTQYSW
jgi:hypothetical protein